MKTHFTLPVYSWSSPCVTNDGHGSRSCEWIEDEVLFSDLPFGQDLFDPLRGETGGIAKPPVNGQRQVVNERA